MSYWTRNRIDVDGMIEKITGPERGGTAVFIGSVRSGAEDGPVEKIDYSAYEPMLSKEFHRILDEAVERWPDARVDAVHRLGMVPVGHASIAVAAAAPHRDEAFAACRYVIEEAKKRLPVWKKEILADGRESWRPNRVQASQESTPRSSS